jgi:hypothetical protein
VLTFFAITTIVNLALGYGLAIFLMRSRQDLSDADLPVQTANRSTETTSPTPPVSTEVKAVPSSAPLAAPSESETPMSELPELVSPMRSTQPQPESSKSGVQGSESSDPIQDSTTSEGNVDPPKAPEETAESPKDSPESSIQKSGSEPESIAEQNPAVEPEPVSIASDDSNTQPPSEEDLLAGIAAFRAQLSAENPPVKSNASNEVDAGSPPADVPG